MRHGLVTALLVSVLGAPAAAATYTVNPVQVVLSADAPSRLVTITNTSSEPLSFQVSTYRWAMDDAGESHLEPTEDLVFFPRLLTIEASAARRLRIGTEHPFGDTEGSYRMVVEELPPSGETTGTHVRLLTRMSIPVFLEPAKVHRDLEVRGAAVADGRLRFRLDNRGNVHAAPASVEISGHDERGAVLFRRQLGSWYVLPGHQRAYDTGLPSESCGSLRSLEIRVAEPTQTGAPLVTAVRPGPGTACGG